MNARIRAVAAAATLTAAIGTVPPAHAAGGRVPVVVFHVYDAEGNRLSFDAFLKVTEASPKGYRNDVAYRLGDGTVVTWQPLVNDSGDPALPVAEAGEGLSFAWPTANTGYSTLLVDDGGAGFTGSGTVNLTFQAALDDRRKLDGALARRPEYVHGATFDTLNAQASALIAQAQATKDDPTRGALGQQALDVLAQAFEVLLEGDGAQRAAAAGHTEWWGVTDDSTSGASRVVGSIRDLVGGNADAYVRVVFDEGAKPSDYDALVAKAEAAGVTVVGQILDSSAMKHVSLSAFERRVRDFVDHFPDIRVWEVGNEVNGGWLGSDVQAKIEYAAAYVKAKDPADITMLTFFWQMGTAGGPSSTLFQWIHDHVGGSLRENTDIVALSTWVGGAPLGMAQDEVFERLHALFPASRVAMGELGYWEPGTTRIWWWRSRHDPTGAVRRALAVHMYQASMAFPYSVGGVFWWYYRQEMSKETELWHAVSDVYRSIYPGLAGIG